MIMKKSKLIVVGLILAGIKAFAQNGMDNVNTFGPGNHFSKLSTPANPNRWEKALGVFQNPLLPTSFLQVNTNPSHMPLPLASIATLPGGLGEVFRTNSPVDASWRMHVFNAGNATNQFQVGRFYSTGGGRDLNIGTNHPAIGAGNIIFLSPGSSLPTGNAPSVEHMRIMGYIQPGGGSWTGGNSNRSGFIGVNNPNPFFNIDMITNAHIGGEYFFRAIPSDIGMTTGKEGIGFVNGAGGSNSFLPVLFGDPGQNMNSSSLCTFANCWPNTDLIPAIAPQAVTRFVSCRSWSNNQVLPQLVQNRHLFSWDNGIQTNMLMAVNGNLRIMNNLNSATNIPGNRLEVTSGTGNPFFGSVNGSSGLRLTNMISSNTPQANPGLGVLSVNSVGDVIYVNAPTGISAGSGNICGATPANPLLNPWEIPLNGNRYNFTSPLSSALSQVNIGFNVCTTGPGRLNVQTDVHRFAGAFVNNNGFTAGFNCVGVGGQATSLLTNAIGVRGQANGASATFTAIGVEGSSNATSGADANYGISGNASNGALESNGGHFEVRNSTSTANYGVKGLAHSNNASNRDVGGLFAASIAPPIFSQRAIGTAGGINLNTTINTSAGIAALPSGISIGVYGYNPNPNPAVIGPNWAGYFDGDVNINGIAYYTSSTVISSDKRFKKDVQAIGSVMDKIKKINSYTYFYKQDEFKEKNFDKDQQIGLIAQELKEVFPQLVKEDNKGYLAINYQGMVPVLLEAIKEQQKQIDEKTGANADVQKQLEEQKKLNDALQGRMDKLEQMISSCCSTNQSGAKPNGLAVNLSDKNVIVLDQNVPNPFAESTVITFNIPTDFTKAQILFNAADGKVIKVVNVTEKGAGHLNVFANDLSNGMYSYSLIIDGKVVATKKMVKQN